MRYLLLMGMGRNSEYMMLEKFASHSTIVIKLQRALYVPSFKFHFISFSLLVKQGNTVIFNHNPHIRVGQQKIYFIERDGLFWFKHRAEETNMSALSITKWNARFSHANCETLKKTANQAVKGMTIFGSLATDKCTTCSECKIPTSDISKNPHVRATRKFSLVHSDVCGPFLESFHGNKYAISFIYDFSR